MDKGLIERNIQTGGANAENVLSTSQKLARKLMYVTVKYSASPTQTGVTVEIDSGAGAGYDVVLSTGTADAQTTVYVPTGDIRIKEDDAIRVTAPAGGGAVTSSIAIYTEHVGF
jgi:translation initiation factor IF-2